MKKSYSLTDPKLKADRKLEAIKHELGKYVARERRKKLPEGFDYWDFDCKVGLNVNEAKPVHVADLNKGIDSLLVEDNNDFYVEIESKTSTRKKK